jgi:hypothetical protein
MMNVLQKLAERLRHRGLKWARQRNNKIIN